MRIVLSLIFIFLPLFSCTGDCFSCHPQLLENLDNNHKPMLLCKSCHTDSTGVAECGPDCFECHQAENISENIEEHKVIKECRECHLKKIILDEGFTPNRDSDLRDFLKL